MDEVKVILGICICLIIGIMIYGTVLYLSYG